ncbi:unnamed protein product [Dracunculus medinensis]|uniref:protein-histidine N-methyltransferase n=1 Tax=Dracunculus medinensis TaxID=318479 RepID=A0A0N4U1N8_DRAME|nr:unnamed protein product [Dracunculus medinensis]
MANSKMETHSGAFECLTLISERKLYYLSNEQIEKNINERGYKNDTSLKNVSYSDLSPRVYEGGLKIWEGCVDLCNYIDSTPDQVVFIDKVVLEIGCGAGLPAILALQKGAKEVFAQDFNQVVIDCFTKDNFALNNVKVGKYRFFAGDWNEFKENLGDQKFDIVLSSETIYNEQMYGKFHDLLDTALKPDGLILIAAKLYYFGVGGNVPGFLDYVKNRNKFDFHICWTSDSDVPRKIIQLTRKMVH